ncbi:MAG: LPP20 family lipoprotein [Proteobacteria bacterium]|nr:LPP20 family lipoprotein [Pseudomonadota bacterium]
MRKFMVIMAVMAIACVMVVGCKSADKQPPSNLPAWALVPPEGGISGVGSAKIGPAGMQTARIEAAANARDEIARTLNVRVKNMIKNFTETTGIGDAQTVDKVFTNVSKQVSKVDLTGSQIKKAHVDQDNNELYVLVAVNPEAVAQASEAMKQAAITSFKNDQALWQKFQAKKGHEELEKEIEKEFGSPSAE